MGDIAQEKVDLFKCTQEKISLIYKGEDLSNEGFLKQYNQFLNDNLFCEKHNILISMHNGSVIYDAIMLTSCVLAIVCVSNLTPEEIANQLVEGTLVSYGKKQTRVKYLGKADIPNYYEFQEKDGVLKIGLKSFSTVIPYYGKAKTLGSVGAGDQHTSLKFQKEVLELSDEEATSFVDTSIVIVTEHSYFNDLLSNIVIRYGGQDYKLTDLVSISFFTEENETQYPGNSSKLEANIKVTSTMSTARELLFNSEENEMLGFCAFGLKGIKNTVGELEDALKRKKIAFSFISYDIAEDRDCLFGLLKDDNLSSPKVYACTKDFLLSHYLGVEKTKGIFKDFDDACNRIIDKQIEYEIVPSDIKWKEQIKIYDLLKELRLAAGGEEHTEKFVIEAYGLLRLILSSVVPLKEFENKDGIDIDYITPREKLDSLKQFVPVSSNIFAYVKKIVPYIENLYEKVFDTNAKADYLSRSITRGNRTALIVDKAYYKPIILRYFAKRGLANAFAVYTESKGRNTQCDEVYIVGKLDILSIMNWNTSLLQRYVLYDAEYRLFAWNLKQYQKKMSLLNQMSYFEVEEGDVFVEEIADVNNEVDMVVSGMGEIERLEQDFLIQNAILHSTRFSGETNSIPAEIARVGVCESGESIYFTKFYKAFVLDLDRKIVKEVETKDLKDGDSIIFTISNGETKDIAELVLSRYAQNSKNEELIQAMKDVNDWKNNLNAIKEKHNYTYTDMVRLFNQFNYKIVAQTIRTWIDKDCHVVGPLNEDAYMAMAEMFKQEGVFNEFAENPRRYIESTQLVRNQRTMFLGIIANVIVAKYSGISLNLDKSFDGVITEEITRFSVLKRLTQIKDVEQFIVPNAKANKPILM